MKFGLALTTVLTLLSQVNGEYMSEIKVSWKDPKRP